jgi:hypothetical protein
MRQALDRRIDLAHADTVGVMNDLALQVGQVDGVEIRQMQLADTGRGQIQRHRRTQPPRPTISTRLSFKRNWPSMSMWCSRICRL